MTGEPNRPGLGGGQFGGGGVVVDQIGPVLAEYVAEALRLLNPKPGRVIIYQPGSEVAWDADCTGQLWGRVVSINPSPTTVKGNGFPCGIPWMDVTLGLGIIRCIASPSSKGTPPSPQAITDDGAVMLADLAVLQEVVLCVGKTVSVISWTPIGPQGGFAGGEWTFTVRIMTCACPDH